MFDLNLVDYRDVSDHLDYLEFDEFGDLVHYPDVSFVVPPVRALLAPHITKTSGDWYFFDLQNHGPSNSEACDFFFPLLGTGKELASFSSPLYAHNLRETHTDVGKVLVLTYDFPMEEDDVSVAILRGNWFFLKPA